MKLFEYIIRQTVRLFRFKLLSLKEPWNIDTPYLKEKTRAFLIGTCVNGNLGDQAISYCSIRFICEELKLPLIEVNINQYWHQRGDLKRLIRPNDVIYIQGGGNIGDEYMGAELCRRDLLKNFPNNTIISLPQTVFFSKTSRGVYEKKISKKIYAGHKNHIIFAREEFSYKELQKLFTTSKVYLVPDIVLFYSDYNFVRKPENKALLCLRADCEGIINSKERENIYQILKFRFANVEFTDTIVKEFELNNRRKMIENKLEEFATAKVIITDRLHGMVLAALSGTPCVVLPNYNSKVRGVYKWLKYLGSICYLEDISALNNAINEVLSHKEEKYSSCQLEKEFKKMISVCLEEI